MNQSYKKDEYIQNPCINEEGEDSVMVLVSTGIKDYIGGFRGIDEEIDGFIIDFPLVYHDIVQQPQPNAPQKIMTIMQPLYPSLGLLKWVSVRPVTHYFLQANKAEDQKIVSGYERVIRQLLSPNVAIPSNEDVRQLTLTPVK